MPKRTRTTRPRRPHPRPTHDAKTTATHTALYIRQVPRDVADALSARAVTLGIHVADVLTHLVRANLGHPRRGARRR